jgi:AraC-like DNA-binding protein
VCIAILGILVLGLGFLDGLAVACALTVVFTVLAAVTLLPALLGVFGWRVLSRRQRRRLANKRAAQRAGGGWARWASAVSLDDIWGRDAVSTQERLRAARSWDERFTIAEAALARRYLTGRAADPEVAFAWRRMAASRGRVRVERLAAEIGWSRKRLWSRFRSQIGLNPKRAAQLVRFDHAAHRLAAGHDAAVVAWESGYTDQSHLHRDVMTFAGVTPAAVADAPWLAVDPSRGPSPDTCPGPDPAGSGTFLQDTRRCLRAMAKHRSDDPDAEGRFVRLKDGDMYVAQGGEPRAPVGRAR